MLTIDDLADAPSVETREWFGRTFGIPIDRFVGAPIAVAYRTFCFDIVQFDRWCGTQGYDENEAGGLSLAQFVERRWGVEAVARFRREILDNT